ncbi:PHD and RING finger domain-containing protein [Paramyrothecium foliicola]|nr:PHD and RING finger domain-containing protein [Paramyrothecium foliicola]
MSEPDQCIICLDPLPRPSSSSATGTDPQASPSAVAAAIQPESVEDDSNYLNIVAALDGCDHVIHDACIRSWAQKTNTCPICRTPFHSVRVYNGHDGTAISTYDVQDKKQVAEFDVQQWLGDNPDVEEEQGNPCPICNSADREDVLLLCDSCDAAYHTHCIGLEQVPEGDWYCMECAHLFQLTQQPDIQGVAGPRPQPNRRTDNRAPRGFNVRTRARLRRARRQARNEEWQGIWGQFSGRFYEMTELDLDNHDDEDEDLERFRRFQLLDRHELQRWQQRMDIAQRLGARDVFANNIPPQISERLQPPVPPVQETRDERRAWGALELAREGEAGPANGNSRKRRVRSVTASPVEPAQEPERKLKRPRTRRLPTQGETSNSASSPAPAPVGASSSGSRATNGSSVRNGPVDRENNEPPLVSSLLKELEPNAASEDEIAGTPGWRPAPDMSSPAISPSPSAYSSPRALSLTPPPLPSAGGRPTSPTLSLSTHIQPRYPPANYSPNRYSSDHSDSDSRSARAEARSPELRQPRPRRAHQVPPRAEEAASPKATMTHEEKKNINDIVKNALRPHWHAQKLTTEQYATINRDISRKLYDEVKDASSLDDKSRRQWEKRATQEVAQAVAELQA